MIPTPSHVYHCSLLLIQFDCVWRLTQSTIETVVIIVSTLSGPSHLSQNPKDVVRFMRQFCQFYYIIPIILNNTQNIECSLVDFIYSFWQIICLCFRHFPPFSDCISPHQLTSTNKHCSSRLVLRRQQYFQSKTSQGRPVCADITKSFSQPTCARPVNTYGSEAYLSKTQGLALSCGSHWQFLLALAGTWPSTPTTNNH